MSAFAGLRSRLHGPEPLFWALMSLPEPGIASILGSSGFDYVVIDAEHGAFTHSSMRTCVEALKATPASAVVRTASADRLEIQRVLGLGVDGVIAPHIETAEEAAAIVRATRYPPDGTREAEAMPPDPGQLFEIENSRLAVMVIIESGRGVENAAGIARVAGLDGIVIGPGDLSADLGVPGEFDHVRVRDAIDRVVSCTLAAGLKVGIGRPTRSEERASIPMNFCFIDSVGLADAASLALQNARDES